MINSITLIRNTILIVACLYAIFIHNQASVASPGLPYIPPTVYFPLTDSEFQSFLASELEFACLSIILNVGVAPGFPNEREQLLRFRSNHNDWYSDSWANLTFDDLEYYIASYFDGDVSRFYSAGFMHEEFQPFFDIITSNLEYFCDQSEYGDNEYLEFHLPLEVLGFDYRNYIMLVIDPPDLPPGSSPVKAFIKGWHPGDDPPEELVPILDFFEEEIIPVLTQHQTFPPPPPPNQDPICVLDCPTLVVAESLPVPVVFDASGSYDPDGDPITYHWDFNGDGIFDGVGDEYTGDPWNPTHEFNQYGIHEVSLKVMDNRDGECVETVVIEIIES